MDEIQFSGGIAELSGCSACGCAVADRAQHLRWHAAQDDALGDMAVKVLAEARSTAMAGAK